jgi:hypothetical protein
MELSYSVLGLTQEPFQIISLQNDLFTNSVISIIIPKFPKYFKNTQILHPPCLPNTTYIESKEYKPYQFTTPRESYKHRKRSRSSRNYSKYSKYTSKQSPKYIGNPSGSKIEISSSSKDRKRDRKYSDKHREDEFKIPSMYSIASSENKKRKDK